MIHTLGLRTGKVLKLGRFELVELGVDWDQYGMSNSHQTQAIGAAVAHLEYDGLIAPSARWQCDNVMLFVTKQSSCEDYLVVRHSIEVDWRVWAAENAR